MNIQSLITKAAAKEKRRCKKNLSAELVLFCNKRVQLEVNEEMYQRAKVTWYIQTKELLRLKWQIHSSDMLKQTEV